MSHMPQGGQPFDPARIVNANASTLVAGTPVYSSAAGYFDAAKADSLAHATCIGLLTSDVATGANGYPQNTDFVTLSTAQWDALCGTSGGLTFGTRYYLSAATAGKFTATAPSSSGQLVAPMLVALSTTQAAIFITPPVLL